MLLLSPTIANAIVIAIAAATIFISIVATVGVLCVLLLGKVLHERLIESLCSGSDREVGGTRGLCELLCVGVHAYCTWGVIGGREGVCCVVKIVGGVCDRAM